MKKILFLITFIILNSCNKNHTEQNQNNNDSIQVEQQNEIEISNIIFNKTVKFQKITVGTDKYGNSIYDYSGFTPYEGKFNKDKNEFLESEYTSGIIIPQKFELSNNKMILFRKKYDPYRNLKNDKKYNFELILRNYGIIAIDKSIKKGYCGMIIFNTTDYEIYDTYYPSIKEDFKNLNNMN